MLLVDAPRGATEAGVERALDRYGVSRVRHRSGRIIGVDPPSGLVRGELEVVVDVGGGRNGPTFVSVLGRYTRKRSILHGTLKSDPDPEELETTLADSLRAELGCSVETAWGR